MITARLPKRGRDDWGSGAFHAPRGGTRKHKGIDYGCLPDSQIYSNVKGCVSKWGLCYAGETFRYIEIETEDKAKHRYFYVHPGLPKGTSVHVGDYIGFAQDIAGKYTTKEKVMKNHIHYEILLNGVETNPETYHEDS